MSKDTFIFCTQVKIKGIREDLSNMKSDIETISRSNPEKYFKEIIKELEQLLEYAKEVSRE